MWFYGSQIEWKKGEREREKKKTQKPQQPVVSDQYWEVKVRLLYF